MVKILSLFQKFKTITENLYEFLNTNDTLPENTLEEFLNQRQNIIEQIDSLSQTTGYNDEIYNVIADTAQIDRKCSLLLTQRLNDLKSQITKVNHSKQAMGAYGMHRTQTWGAFVDNKK